MAVNPGLFGQLAALTPFERVLLALGVMRKNSINSGPQQSVSVHADRKVAPLSYIQQGQITLLFVAHATRLEQRG